MSTTPTSEDEPERILYSYGLFMGGGEDLPGALSFEQAVVALSAYIQRKCNEARIDEVQKRVAAAKRLLERSRKWQLTEAGRHDMIVGEELMPAQDRLRQLIQKFRSS